MYVACQEHIDHAIEAYIDKFERSPDLYLLDRIDIGETKPERCHFCERTPVYLVK
ncbi:MAG: CxxH/CxxC protein [Firmicutes bacterium]|nr:CxxH/CxxC protein [Bacillota bacterium]